MPSGYVARNLNPKEKAARDKSNEALRNFLMNKGSLKDYNPSGAMPRLRGKARDAASAAA